MIFWVVYTVLFDCVLTGWQENLPPRIYLQPRERSDYSVFRGNTTTIDHFSVSLRDGDKLLVAGRNVLYKLDIKTFKVEQSLVWTSTEQDKSVCLVKGKSDDFCQNYIKVLKKYENDSGRYLVCGTNAYKPVCRDYVEDSGSFLMTNEVKGVGKCPYSPLHNSTAVLVGDRLYAGTTADYQGVDPLIYRDPLRTLQFDPSIFNNPSFVGSFNHDQFVYFFFREGAVEYMNCGKSVFSRVARVCKNDQGGTRSLNKKWTSFVKARINCSVPGNFPFYFDEIQDISPIIQGNYGQENGSQIVYAVFNTPPNSIGGSAVCAYSLNSINNVFDGQFKEQRSPSDNWLPVNSHNVPEPRPGSCTNNSLGLSDANMNFIKTHPLMNEAVAPFFPGPLLVRTGLNVGLTCIGVDSQVVTPDGTLYDVLFIGTKSGNLLKTVNSVTAKVRSTAPKPVIIEEIEALDGPATSIHVVNNKKGPGHIIIMSATEVRSFPLYRCGKAASCSECVALQDPYCAWNIRKEVCQGAVSWSKGSHDYFLQSVSRGRHVSCPRSDTKPTSSSSFKPGTVIEQRKGGKKPVRTVPEDRKDLPPSVRVSTAMITMETIKYIVTVFASIIAGLVVGFVSGFCCGRKCGKDDNNVPYQDAEYEYFEQRQLPPRPLPGPALQPLLNQNEYKQQPEETLYAEPVLINHNKPLNPLGTTLAHKPYPNTSAVYGHTAPSLYNQNKFNTISNIHKRGGHYGVGRAGLLAEDRGELGGGPPSHYDRGGGVLSRGPNSSIYHMGTLSRASKHPHDPAQVVDSAYGTTRSVKKVYL